MECPGEVSTELSSEGVRISDELGKQRLRTSEVNELLLGRGHSPTPGREVFSQQRRSGMFFHIDGPVLAEGQ